MRLLPTAAEPQVDTSEPELNNPPLPYAALIAGAGALGCILFSLIAVALSLTLPVRSEALLAVATAVLLSSVVIIRSRSAAGTRTPVGAYSLAMLVSAGTVLLLMTIYHLGFYIRLPVDLLSFSESPFVTDILKFRSGQPLYTPAEDNNSYPYTPGVPILTYLISAALGRGDDIAFFRTVQFGYVVLAAVMAASICDLLARRILGSSYRHRPLWIAAWLPILVLVATEPTFNAYTHSLHNDGLALLLSMTAFWLMARWALAHRAWILVAMAILPAIGFLVKQNQLLWAGVFGLYLIVDGGLGFRRLALFVAGTTVLVVSLVAACYLLWGEPFRYWIFDALGDKQVSLLRSARHALLAGSYGAMGLLALWTLVLRGGSRGAAVLWGGWAVVFSIQAYTSGIGFAANHMGPGVMLAVCWFLVTLVKVWPKEGAGGDFRTSAQPFVAAAVVLLVVSGLGLVREPVSPVPFDFSRYVAEIEAEFADLPAEMVLLDTGTWPYLGRNILMRDRATPVSLHVGINQPEIGSEHLASTIDRFRGKYYARILARQIDTDQSRYDYQNRGSGVRDAILENYHEVRRIRAVDGIQKWWPLHLVSEIVVLERNVTAEKPGGGS